MNENGNGAGNEILTAGSTLCPLLGKDFFLNSGGTRSEASGKLQANQEMALSLLIGRPSVYNIVNVSGIVKNLETVRYTNDLYDALVQKNSKLFGQCRCSELGYKSTCTQVDGFVDADTVACKFRDHFAKAYSCSNADRAEQLRCEYQSLRSAYCVWYAYQ